MFHVLGVGRSRSSMSRDRLASIPQQVGRTHVRALILAQAEGPFKTT